MAENQKPHAPIAEDSTQTSGTASTPVPASLGNADALSLKEGAQPVSAQVTADKPYTAALQSGIAYRALQHSDAADADMDLLSDWFDDDMTASQGITPASSQSLTEPQALSQVEEAPAPVFTTAPTAMAQKEAKPLTEEKTAFADDLSDMLPRTVTNTDSLSIHQLAELQMQEDETSSESWEVPEYSKSQSPVIEETETTAAPMEVGDFSIPSGLEEATEAATSKHPEGKPKVAQPAEREPVPSPSVFESFELEEPDAVFLEKFESLYSLKDMTATLSESDALFDQTYSDLPWDKVRPAEDEEARRRAKAQAEAIALSTPKMARSPDAPAVEAHIPEMDLKGNRDESPAEFYLRVLKMLYKSDDLGVDSTAKARIAEAVKLDQPPQVTARDLIAQKVINSIQLARTIARAHNRREVMSFLDVPPESMDLRSELDSKVTRILRDARIIPLWRRVHDDGSAELHLGHETALRDLMIESQLAEFLPKYRFYWHFAMRDVCGAYWLSSSDESIDSNMEAEALLDRIVATAIDARSSDIHIDPSIRGELKAIVKYRIDGSVQSKEVITFEQLDKLRVRIENLARMPKVNLNHPNKGAFSRAGFDWRVQVQPHAGRQGPVPRIVIRRLQPDVMPMETLGYSEDFIDKIKAAASAPNGVIFWTGPTGSGKTESIHSAVVSANPMGRGLSVHTIEDPPEKRVPGYAVQMEMSDMDPARSGLELLKSSLRADPDVVIFGEVRDPQMAELVFEAANTGHLVFTTLHTNTAIDAITRLQELHINGFLLSYIRGIAAQRLVRRLCSHCRMPVKQADEYTRYVFERYEVPMDGATLYKANPDGCPSCNFTGYHGRIAIAEWLVPNKELIEATLKGELNQLEDIAKRAGWLPMGHMGVLHVKHGITDAAELSDKVLELSGDTL